MQETTSQEVVSCGERSPHIPICYESLVGDMGSTLCRILMLDEGCSRRLG